MKKLLPILFLFCACSAFGAGVERISLLITVTNTAKTSNTLTINATTRYWTNASTLGTILTNLVSTNHTTTNLFNQIASFPYAGPLILQYASSNQIRLIGPLGGALAGSASGGWAEITLSTQSGPQTYTALWPMENMVGATNRTNQGSALVSGLSTYSTQAFATNSTAVSNLLQKGIGPQQRVQSGVEFHGRTSINSNFFATNGFLHSVTGISLVTTSLVNYGDAIRSEGIGGNSLQVGSNAVAAGLRSVAIGNNAYATNTDAFAAGGSSIASNKSVALGTSAKASDASLAIGRLAEALFEESTVIGNSAFSEGGFSVALGSSAQATTNSVGIGRAAQASGTNSIALGRDAIASEQNAIAIGFGAQGVHSNGVAIGTAAATTSSNQIQLGTSTTWVQSPGIFAGNTHTNTTIKGTNVINARVDLTSRANTSLANGNNAGVVLGTNVYVRFPSGPTAAYVINGIAAEVDGSWHIAEFINPVNSLTIADNSGTDPVAANRIRTGTGADVVFTNNPVVLQFIYNATDARWKIANWFR